MIMHPLQHIIQHITQNPIPTGIYGTIASSSLTFVSKFQHTLPVVQWFAALAAILVALVTSGSIIYSLWRQEIERRDTEETFEWEDDCDNE